MSNEDKKIESDFEDFDDSVSDNIELDSDISGIDENAVEKALQNIASQISEADENEELSDNFNIENENTDTKEVQETIETQEDNTDETIEQQEEFQEEQPQEKSEENSSKSVFSLDNDNALELSRWEELNESNDVVKKYIIYISKDFIPYIDNMTTDERSAYINDAIQQKLDLQDEHKQVLEKRKAFLHVVLAIIIVLALTPFALLWANKAIMATFENYKYSQDNFEKLYKHRFEKDKAYMRSLQYNKDYEKRTKKEAN
ncbi:MAG: hypothetical protein IJ877_04225 [Candidatus Gastranaerophilales bacterium]|nr:hypothetical protein [Candidatus Gastranaerophilales bacterium]